MYRTVGVRLYTCLPVRMHIRTHARIPIYTPVHVSTRIFGYMPTNLAAFMSVHTTTKNGHEALHCEGAACVYAHAYTHPCICLCTCVYACPRKCLNPLAFTKKQELYRQGLVRTPVRIHARLPVHACAVFIHTLASMCVLCRCPSAYPCRYPCRHRRARS